MQLLGRSQYDRLILILKLNVGRKASLYSKLIVDTKALVIENKSEPAKTIDAQNRALLRTKKLAPKSSLLLRKELAITPSLTTR